MPLHPDIVPPQDPDRHYGSPAGENSTLAHRLDALTRAGELWRAEGDKLRCLACGHRCLIAAGRRGICKVRFNAGGQLRVPFGYVAGLQSDPVEKKPFYHVYPGSDALTFGMLGCDFHCAYCQNWVTSQALRDAASGAPIREVTARELAQAGLRLGSRLVVSSYNEPLITVEWASAVFREAKTAGLACAFVSNGNATTEALDYLQPLICAYKVDLKCFDDRRYRAMGGTLDSVTTTIRALKQRGIWVEVVTLLIPGFNDDPEELRALTSFLNSVGPEIPWHVTAFHPDYRMLDRGRTAVSQLIRAAKIGAEAGLKFVYAGNSPGAVGRWENTYCPGCGGLVIGRTGFHVEEVRLDGEGRCRQCGTVLPGVGLGETKASSPGNTRWPKAVRLDSRH